MTTLPEIDKIEVSVFGPGYGECVVIHLGCGEWIIIDSCINPHSRQPAALEYFQSINLEPENSVKAIIASHWHDDHIRGLGQVLEICQKADFFISDSLRPKEFLTILASYENSPRDEKNGIKEFQDILYILKSRKQSPKFASIDKLLFRSGVKEIFALSPTDAAKIKAIREFKEIIPKAGSEKGVLTFSPKYNFTSVVLWIKIAEIYLLMGADLENSPIDIGWQYLIGNSNVIREQKAEVYKVAHHGSKNADCPEIWTSLLKENPYAIVTPFFKGEKVLPTKEDVSRICDYTDNGYISAKPKFPGKTKREKVVDQLTKTSTKFRRRVNDSFGHVRLRYKLNGTSPNWKVELLGDAIRLDCIPG